MGIITQSYQTVHVMKYKPIHLLVLLGFLFLAGQSLAQHTPFRLKVMSFNVRMSGELTLYSVTPFADLIRQYNPDMIALQEIDYKVARSNNKDFVTELGAALGMFPVFGKAISSGSGEYGVAVLSKYPFTSIRTELLPKPDGTKEQRAVLITEIQFPSGQNLRFASTHLDHSSDAVRSVMANAVNAYLLKGDMPTVLGGDFNAKPDESTIATGMQQWNRICTDDPTYPNSPTSKIDYLFGYPKTGCRTVSYQVIRQTNISDHCPIVAEIEFQ